MKTVRTLSIVVLILLVIASGISKVLLVEQEVVFFSQYGFSNWLLMVFGASQLVAGALLMRPKTRGAGAALVILTFLVSAILLVLAGNLPLAIVTLAFVLLALVVMKLPRDAY